MKGRMKMAEKRNGREKEKNKEKNWDKIKNEGIGATEESETEAGEKLFAEDNTAGDNTAENNKTETNMAGDNTVEDKTVEDKTAEDKTAEDKADANEENLNAEEDADTDKKSGAEEDAEQGGKAEKSKKKIGRKDKAEEEVTLTKKEADKILNKLAELNDKYLHVVAEYDNFRKRSQKEREGLYADAYADALKILLPIADNLERAASYTDGDKIVDGVAMTLKQFSGALEKLGIESFGNPGDAFDPNLHNAIMHCEDDSLGENVIAEVYQHGYKKGDRVIRFAMVKVAN